MLILLATLVTFAIIIMTAAWLSIANAVLPEGGRLATRGTAYVDSWGLGPAKDAVNSVRIGGIGATSFGRELRVKVVGRDGLSVLDMLSWKIDSQVSPDLNFSKPIENDSIGAVLIAIE